MKKQFDFHVKKHRESDTTAVYPISYKAKKLLRNYYIIELSGEFEGAALFRFLYNPFEEGTVLSESGLTHKIIE